MSKEINAVINSMAYSYQIKVLINGTDIGMVGGKSQSMRLFSVEHSMKSEATPDMRQRLFVLKEGNNDIVVEFKKTGNEPDRLSIDLEVEGYETPLFSISQETGAGGKVEKKISI